MRYNFQSVWKQLSAQKTNIYSSIHSFRRTRTKRMMQGLSSSLSCSIPCSLKFKAVKASYDTQQRLPYNPNAPKKLNNTQPQSQPLPLTTSSPPALSTRKDQYIADLLKRDTPLPTTSGNYYSTVLLFHCSISFFCFQLTFCLQGKSKKKKKAKPI